MHFRNDIQQLRGLSVILIVLFHLQVPGFASAFLGVDLFFVISGFLMAVVYDSNKKMDFFRRRATRLLPSYYIIVVLALFAASALTVPSEFDQVAKQAMFASAYLSNIGFWLDTSYFDKTAFSLLLHLWSLGVEIQFYLIVPVLVWLLRKNTFVIPLLLVGSLLACFTVVQISPKSAFFMMPFRLWEFLIGFFVAFHLCKNGNVLHEGKTYVGAIAFAALCLIPWFNIDGEALIFMGGHPGIHALMVCLLGGMVLVFGLPQAFQKSRIGMALVKCGRYSYSIYLVHFPVIVLYLYSPYSGTQLEPSSILDSVILLVLIAVLSVAFYHLVEANSKKLAKPSWFVAASLFLLVVPLVLKTTKFSFYSDEEQHVFNAWTDRSQYRCGKLFRFTAPSKITCKLTSLDDEPKKNILMIGNSHADSIKTEFASLAESKNIEVYFQVPDNSLQPGGFPAAKIMKEVERYNIDALVLHFSAKGTYVEEIKPLIDLAEEKGIVVSFIMPVPTWDTSIPLAVYNHLNGQRALPVQSRKDYFKIQNELFAQISTISNTNFKIYGVVDLLCKDNCRYLLDTGELLYFDDSHLTLTGSGELESVFKDILDDVLLVNTP